MMTTTHCPCGSNKNYLKCCGQYIEGGQAAPTPEALMRSRYTAYTQARIDYIEQTMRGPAAQGFNRAASQAWAQQVKWLGLQVLKAPTATDNTGQVEFIARYQQDDQTQHIHEISEFQRIEGRWFYLKGSQPKVQRNGPCPCGSGKKYKKCCG